MKKIWTIAGVLLLTTGLLIPGCGSDDKPTSPGKSWQTIFEDNFDGDNLNTSNWTQFESAPPPYSLTGSGELQIDGEIAGEDGATFVYNTAITGDYVKVITKFRTTQKDSVQDDVDIAIVLNSNIDTDDLYLLILTSDPFGDSRIYELIIAKIDNGVMTVLVEEIMGGTTPQILADNDYILEGTNSNGTITFTVKDGGGNVLKSVSSQDSSFSGGKIAFNGDLNIGTSEPQSIFFDYVIVQTYQ